MLPLWIIYFLCCSFALILGFLTQYVSLLFQQDTIKLVLTPPLQKKKKVSESNAKHWTVSTACQLNRPRWWRRTCVAPLETLGREESPLAWWQRCIPAEMQASHSTQPGKRVCQSEGQLHVCLHTSDTQLLPATGPARPASHENSREAQMQAPGKHSKRSHLTPSNGSCADASHNIPGASTVQSTLFI